MPPPPPPPPRNVPLKAELAVAAAAAALNAGGQIRKRLTDRGNRRRPPDGIRFGPAAAAAEAAARAAAGCRRPDAYWPPLPAGRRCRIALIRELLLKPPLPPPAPAFARMEPGKPLLRR